MATLIPTAAVAGRRLAFGDLVVAPIVRAIEGDAEAIRIAGFGEQGLRLLRIADRRPIQFGHVAVDARGRDHPGRDEELTHQVVQRRLQVHRVGHRLAHPLVLEWVAPLDVGRAQLGAALIEAEEHRVQLRPIGELQLRVAADLGEGPVGHGLDQIDLAIEQGGDVLGIAFGDVNDAVDVVREVGRTPPVRIADHDPAAVRLERFEPERPGAVGVARGKRLFARP